MREMYFTDYQRRGNEILFTDFRFPRKDRDWQIEETVRIVYKPKNNIRKVLGEARIIRIIKKNLNKPYHYYVTGFGRDSENTFDVITPEEAYEQGFKGMHGGGDLEKMKIYYHTKYGYYIFDKTPLNKLMLYWIEPK